MTRTDTIPPPGTLRRRWLEVLAVFVCAALAYPLLTGELPTDDTARFTPSLAAGIAEWDPAHLLMQPLTLLWCRVSGMEALAGQHAVNVVSAAVSLALLALLLGELGCSRVARLALVVLAGGSFHVLALATSGHMKLLLLPFLVLALREATLWERELAGGREAGRARLWRAGAWMGVACAFLVSSALIAAAMGAAAWFARGLRRRAGLLDLAAVGCSSLGVALALFFGAYLFAHEAGGFVEFLRGSQASGRGGPTSGAVESLARLVFGLALDFVDLGDLGAILRARMSGALGSFAGYGAMLVWPATLIVVVLGALAALALGWLVRARERGWLGLGAWAQVLGALAFAFVWNLSEAEFYFQITLPLVVLAALELGRRAAPVALAAALLVAGHNLASYSLPRKRYRLQDEAARLAREFGARDLFVGLQDYPGGPCLAFLQPLVPAVPVLYLDEPARVRRGAPAALAELDTAVHQAWERGGRVIAFRLFDERDWNAPWAVLRMHGLGKDVLHPELRARYTIRELGPCAGIPASELLPR